MSDRFEQIRRKYIGTFVAKQNEIKTAWENKDIAHVHDLMHKLTGSSGGYGFNSLCDFSQQAMQLTYNNKVSNLADMQQCLLNIYSILQNNYESAELNANQQN